MSEYTKPSIFVRYFLFFSLMNVIYNLQAQQFKVLLVTKTKGWHHGSILEGVEAFKRLSKEHQFELEWSNHLDRFFTDDALQSFDVIVFLNTTGDILTNDQQDVMERFIQSGKGFVGVHSASDTEYGWPWYTRLVGRMFVIHPAIQTARLEVINPKFIGLEHWPEKVWITDEWYEFGEENSPYLKYLLALDERTYDPKVEWGEKKGQGMGTFHPISWYQEFDGGRSFYTALGHQPAIFSNALFLAHLYGGLYWAATGGGLDK